MEGPYWRLPLQSGAVLNALAAVLAASHACAGRAGPACLVTEEPKRATAGQVPGLLHVAPQSQGRGSPILTYSLRKGGSGLKPSLPVASVLQSCYSSAYGA